MEADDIVILSCLRYIRTSIGPILWERVFILS